MFKILNIFLINSTILAIFDLLRNLMCYFSHVYIEQYTFKIYKKLIILKYAIRRLKQYLNYLYFSLHVTAICKIRLNDK